MINKSQMLYYEDDTPTPYKMTKNNKKDKNKI